MNYVSEDSVKRARDMEKRLQSLRSDAGVIFVGVTAEPAPDGNCKTFNVHLGVTRAIGVATGRALVRHVLDSELSGGFLILASVYQGVPGAAHDASDEAPGVPAA